MTNDSRPSAANASHNELAVTAAIDKACEHWANGNVDGALASCRRALALDPSSVPALANSGTIMWLNGDVAEAERLYIKAHELDPTHVGVMLNIATLRNEEGDLEKEEHAYERQDFWTATKNKQLNFVQHVKTLLKINGRCAIVVPDNVLFEGGAGETVRRNLLAQCDVHTLLRLPTGIFYAQGVKANVLFFDAKPAQEKPWTSKLWVYDLRTNMHFTQKTNPLRRSDLDEFVDCYHPANRHRRKPTWSEQTLDGRWRVFDYEDLLKRDKVNLDIFWLRDKSLEESDDLPEPDVLAQEIADDLQTALEQFQAIAEKLKG